MAIVNLVYQNTIDSRIYDRLYKRLKLIEDSLGAYEGVLGEEVKNLTGKLLDPRLSIEQQEESIKQTARAIENKRQLSEKLEKDAGALASGDYILDKIKQSHQRKRWLRGEDVLAYVKDVLLEHFKECHINPESPGSPRYQIYLSPVAHEEFQSFARNNPAHAKTQLVRPNAKHRYQFISRIIKPDSLPHSVEPVSQLHPLTKFAAHIDNKYGQDPEVFAVALRLSRRRLEIEELATLGKELELGATYLIAIQRWNMATANEKEYSHIAYAGVNIADGEALKPEDVETMVRFAVDFGQVLASPMGSEQLAEAAALLKNELEVCLGEDHEKFIGQKKAEVMDRVSIQRRAAKDLYDHQRKMLSAQRDQFIRNAEDALSRGDQDRHRELMGVARATDGRIAQLDHRFEISEQKRRKQEAFEDWGYSEVAGVLIRIVD